MEGGFGITPGSGRAMAMSNQLDTNQALARASAANKVREAARMEGFALTDRAVNALAGYPAMGMSATGAELVVVYTQREPDIYRLISSWKATKPQRKLYEKGHR